MVDAVRRSLPARALTVACLLALFAQLVFAIPRLSATYDEPIYTGIGYADLTTGDFYWHGIIGHGPLANMISAWPLLLSAPRIDVTRLPTWGSDSSLGFGREVLEALGPLPTVLFLTRLPITWLTLLLAALVTRWTRRAWGRGPGLLALAFFAFEPNLIAHGHLNTTDMSVALAGFASTYLLSRYLRRPGLVPYVGAGLATGAAIASKASGLFWLGAHALVLFATWLTTARKTGGSWISSLATWGIRGVGLAAIALLGLWAGYGFEFGPVVPGGVPVPAPSHWVAFTYLRDYLATGQTTYLSGHLYEGGHWLYFPTTLMLKTPVPLLLAAGLGLVVVARRGLGRSWNALPFVLTPAAYLLVSMRSGLNIGHRHLLPVLPYLVMLAAQGARLTLSRLSGAWRSRARWAAAGLGLWYIAGTVSIFPRYLSFFNRLAGGPAGGYRALADSSTDWGQGFYDLQAYLDGLEDRGDAALPTYLAAFSSLDPHAYGLTFEPLPPGDDAPLFLPSRFRPEPGRYVISVVPLQGVWLLDPDTYDWFRHQEPVARVGHVFNVYEVPPVSAPVTRLLACMGPAPTPDRAALNEGFGAALAADAVVSAFDCARGWLYPASGGLMVLGNGLTDDAWVAERMAGAVLWFRQREHWRHPALSVVAWAGAPMGSRPAETEVRLLPDSWTTAQPLPYGVPTAGPVDTSGPLAFLGYEVTGEDDSVTLTTFWQVRELTSRPLSLMAHGVNAEGVTVTVADGLAIAVDTWQPGDVLVQRHVFAGVSEAPAYFVSGAYWLDSMERWQVACGEGCTSTALLIVPPGSRP